MASTPPNTDNRLSPGDELELEITGVAHGGVFVARYAATESEPGRVVFVADTLPGERVRARVTDTAHAAFWRADTVEVVRAAPERQTHVWAAADVNVAPENRPGGAEFGHISIDYQRELKRQVITDALKRIGKLELPVTVAAANDDSPEGTRWRTRVSLHVDEAGRVGPYAARSHRVIQTDDLPLATQAIENAARGLQGVAGRIDLVQPADGDVRVLHRPERSKVRATTQGQKPPRSKTQRSKSQRRPVTPTIVERVGGRNFSLDADGFWQVHRTAAQTLTSAVSERLQQLATEVPSLDPAAHHLDLFGGVGLFAATLANFAGTDARVTSVESHAGATAHAAKNLAKWPGVTAATARVDRWLNTWITQASAAERASIRGGVVLLDPPRAGAGKDVVDAIVALSPAAVIYVACDPAALARDLATFATAGYTATQVDGFDLFPHSHHVEAVVCLVRS